MLATLATPEALDAQKYVTQDVFRIMAGMDVDSSPDPFSNFDGVIDSLLYYIGGAEGSLVLECSPNVACAFAERVTGLRAASLNEDDVRDAVGELVNMIGGNLKALLPGDTAISTPLVFTSPQDLPLQDGASQISSLDFRCEFGQFRLSLYRHG
jgi:CheY-specific phosphatase CheX